MDSRLRGNDVIIERADQGISRCVGRITGPRPRRDSGGHVLAAFAFVDLLAGVFDLLRGEVGLAPEFHAVHFAIGIFNILGAVFTGLPATVQTLPFSRQG